MAERKAFEIQFWGVRGSYAAPSARTVRYGGNTSCVEVRVCGHRVILDAGTGLIYMGQEYLKQNPAGPGENFLILLSHHHFDHIQGFPFFRPAFRPPHKVTLYGPAFGKETVRETLDRLMVSPMSPFDLRHMPGVGGIEDLRNGQNLLWPAGEAAPRLTRNGERPDTSGAVFIEPYLNRDIHPRDGIILYRLSHAGRRIAYCTDMEGVHAEMIDFVKDCDLLIFDAMYTDEEYNHPQYPTKGWGHSTSSMAVEIARRSGAKQMALFHHNPDHDDDALDAKTEAIRKAVPHAFNSREGMVLEV
jgi:phosphoribosyl 1,2-cyclic phosphodiesterase